MRKERRVEKQNRVISRFPSHTCSTHLSPPNVPAPLSLDLPVGGLFLPLALKAGKSPMLLSLPSNSHRGFNSLPRYPRFCVVFPSCEGGTTAEPHRASPSSRPVLMLFKAWPHLHLLAACLPWRTATPPHAGAL